MKYFIIIVLFFSFKNSCGQSINWSNAKEWKLYKLRGHGLFNYKIDTLKNFESYSLNKDTITEYLKQSTVIPKDSTPVWMGEYVSSCMIGDNIFKLEISFYGGFFYCETDRQVYQIPNALKKEWQDYIMACYRTFYP